MSYNPNLTIKSVYDEDEELRGSLNRLIPEFEYPDWSHKTIGDVTRKIGPVYVLAVVFDRELSQVVSLTKLKGPKHLLGKLTFPGGRIEAQEHVRTAATRELKEETSVFVPAVRWQLVSEQDDLIVVAATADVSEAKTQEDEPVVLLDVKYAQQHAAENPQFYATDFLALLGSAKAALK